MKATVNNRQFFDVSEDEAKKMLRDSICETASEILLPLPDLRKIAIHGVNSFPNNRTNICFSAKCKKEAGGKVLLSGAILPLNSNGDFNTAYFQATYMFDPPR